MKRRRRFSTSLQFVPLAAGLVMLNGRARAADATLLVVDKEVALEQTGPGAPNPRGDTPYRFNSSTTANGVGVLVSASVQSLPAGGVHALPADGNDLVYEADFGTANALNAALPNGSYRMVVQTVHDGQHTLTLTLTGDAYPNDPHCSNYDAAQHVDAGAAFTVTWDAFSGGTVADFIQFQVRNDVNETVIETSGPGQAGALNGTSTSMIIPAGTLAAGRNYSAHLLFAKVTSADTTTYPGATAVTAYSKEMRFSLVTRSAPDTTSPALSGSVPARGQNDVAINSAIVFQFSEAMQPGHSITWSGVSAAAFSYEWTSDQRSLFCIYNSALPANTSIHWTLNPSGFSQSFRDVAGNKLATDTSGQFSTGFTIEVGKDVQFLYAVKAKSYSQADAGSPQPDGPTPFVANAVAVAARPGRLISGILKLPDGSTVALEASDGGGSDAPELQLEREFASQAELDDAAPNGAYTLTVQTVHDGTHAVVLDVTGNLYPNTPHVSNFTAAQAINPDTDFVLTWDAFAGGTAGDFIQLSIENEGGGEVFSTPSPIEAGALTGTATSVRLPAGTLQSGRMYRAALLFAKIVSRDTTGYPGAIGLGGYLAITHLALRTSGTPVADVGTYIMFKLELYAQGGTGQPTPKGGTPYRFIANVFPNAPGDVDDATLRLPGGMTRGIPSSDAGKSFSLGEVFGSEAALDAAYPPGTYTFDFATAHDGFRSVNLSLPSPAYPTPIPHISNYAAAQSVNAAADFVLSWDPFVGGVTGDSIVLNVNDESGNLIFPPADNPDTGTFNTATSSAKLKANTLQPGHTYQAQLLFRHRTSIDTTSYPGATGFVQFRRRTDFPIMTPATVAPRLVPLGFDGQGRFQFEIIGSGNLTVQASPNLAPGSWTLVGAPVLTNGKWIFTDPDTAHLTARAYRAQSQ